MTPYSWKKNDFYGGHYAVFREVQEKTMRLLPHSGMVVTMDIGETESIHPVNKRPVGERMAALAMRRVYGYKTVVCEGPMYSRVQYKGKQVEVCFKKGLWVRVYVQMTGKCLRIFTWRGPINAFIKRRLKLSGTESYYRHLQ